MTAENFSIDHYQLSRDHSAQKADEAQEYRDGGTDGSKEVYFHQRVRTTTTFGTDDVAPPSKEEIEASLPKDRLNPGTYSQWARNPATGALEQIDLARYSIYGRPRLEKPPEPEIFRPKPRRRSKKQT